MKTLWKERQGSEYFPGMKRWTEKCLTLKGISVGCVFLQLILLCKTGMKVVFVFRLQYSLLFHPFYFSGNPAIKQSFIASLLGSEIIFICKTCQINLVFLISVMNFISRSCFKVNKLR